MATPHPSTSDRPREARYSRAVRTTLTVVAALAVIASIVAGATLWLLLTDPVVAAEASAEGDLMPVFEHVMLLIGRTLVAALAYL